MTLTQNLLMQIIMSNLCARCELVMLFSLFVFIYTHERHSFTVLYVLCSDSGFNFLSSLSTLPVSLRKMVIMYAIFVVLAMAS